jgi:uncharacterized membrane protein
VENSTPSQRAYDLDRTIAFSDGVFAIAITLLVISIGVPNLSGKEVDRLDDELWDLRWEVFAYFLSFAVIGKFWLAHHRMFGWLTRVDGALLSLNLFYLAFIAVTPFSTDLLGEYSEEPTAVMVYAGNLAVVGVLSSLMWYHAERAKLLDPERGPRGGHEMLAVSMIPWAIFALSMPLALLSTTAAMLSWILIVFAQPRLLRAQQRRAGS